MRIAVGLLLLLMAGCSHTVAPPPAPLVMQLSWLTNGNPGIPACVTSPPPCLQGYTLARDGVTIASLEITALTFTDSGVPIGQHTYTLAVNAVDPRGVPVIGPPAVWTSGK